LGQTAYIEIYQASFIYPYNDLRHFILNILLLPSVGLERGFSYNAPVWSVSVEVVLYVAFFAYCWFSRARFLHLLGFSALGFLALTHLYQPIGRGAGSFFLGGCVYQVFAYSCASKRRNMIAGAVGVTAAALWIATLCFSYADFSLADYPLLLRLSAFFPAAVLFPVTILSLALHEACRGPLGKKFAWLGNISYSSYLWHFPLQLAFVLAAPALGATSAFFRSTASLILFFTLLIAVSLLSYRYIEMPAQRRIRQMWHATPKERPSATA
jgi:peptidoglycan/LPS O-acetylase OafA/YrhL